MRAVRFSQVYRGWKPLPPHKNTSRQDAAPTIWNFHHIKNGPAFRRGLCSGNEFPEGTTYYLASGITASGTGPRLHEEPFFHTTEVEEVHRAIGFRVARTDKVGIRVGGEEHLLHATEVEEVDLAVIRAATRANDVRVTHVTDVVAVAVDLQRVGVQDAVVGIVGYAITIRVSDGP